jgi:hypothetical protein
MTDAQRMSYYGLPEEQKREFLDNIARSTAGQVRGLSDRRSGVGAVQAAAQGERDAYKSLLSADSAARMANIDRLQNVRSAYAQYEDKAFALNELEPYMQEVNAAAALQGAGLQNIGGALNTLALSDMYGVLGEGASGAAKSAAEIGSGVGASATGVQSAMGTDWQKMISGDTAISDMLMGLSNMQGQPFKPSDSGVDPMLMQEYLMSIQQGI